MDIRQSENNGKGKFFIEEEGRVLAEMVYVWYAPDWIIIEHTEVSPELEGKGIGRRLVEQAVEFAREEGIKIGAHCPFARSVFEKTPEYSDVYMPIE